MEHLQCQAYDEWFTSSLITSFMWPTWGPSGADRTQMGPMFAPWTLLSGPRCYCVVIICIIAKIDTCLKLDSIDVHQCKRKLRVHLVWQKVYPNDGLCLVYLSEPNTIPQTELYCIVFLRWHNTITHTMLHTSRKCPKEKQKFTTHKHINFERVIHFQRVCVRVCVCVGGGGGGGAISCAISQPHIN